MQSGKCIPGPLRPHLGTKHIQPPAHTLSVTGEDNEMTAVLFNL